MERPLTSPPFDLLSGATLFLDLDGTLLDIAERPDLVVADAELQALLTVLMVLLQGRVAVISGRSIKQIDQILGECAADLVVSGSHGCEHRWNGILARPVRPPSLDNAAARLSKFATTRPGVIVEEKSYGVGLHYRMAPDAADEAHALAEALAGQLDLDLQHGKMMIELRVAGGNKGTAVRSLMSREPMAGTRPLFIGDDVTDEEGFAAAVELGGHAILVGQPRATAAEFILSSPSAVREWLWTALR